MYVEKLEVLYSSYVDVYENHYGYIIPTLLYISRTLNRPIYSAIFLGGGGGGGWGDGNFSGVIVITRHKIYHIVTLGVDYIANEIKLLTCSEKPNAHLCPCQF